MRYFLIVLTLAIALGGAFKEIVPAAWRRLALGVIVLCLLGSSVGQLWIASREDQISKYRSETGRLHSHVRSGETSPVLQLCGSGLKYAGPPGKPIFDFGGEALLPSNAG